jgi:hypothetical protein
MTAIGFTIAWIAAVAAFFFYDPTRSLRSQSFKWEFACAASGAGVVLVLMGIGLWLFRVMP